MTTHTLDTHLQDDEIVRIIDGQSDAARAELAACAQCAARAETLRQRSVRFSRLLAETDWPVPAAAAPDVQRVAGAPAAGRDRGAAVPRSRTAAAPYLRIAAGVVLLLALGLTVTPARAWIGGALSDVWSTVSGRPTPATPPAASRESDEPAQAVRFTPRPGEMTLRFTVASGAVTLARASDDRFGIEVVADGGSPDLLLLDDGVRIHNADVTGASYSVTAPSQTTSVRILVGDRTVRLVSRSELAAGTRVLLH